METCNVRIVTIPLPVNGLECYDGNVSVSNPRIISHVPVQKTIVAGGVNKVRQLGALSKNTPDPVEKTTRMLSLHHRGILLLWDADTQEVVGMCDHNDCSLEQCIVTSTYIYVRGENEAGRNSGADSVVYVWHTKTLEAFRQIQAHDGRVTSMVVSDTRDECFATAGIDYTVRFWDLAKNVLAPVQKITLNSIATVSMYFHGMVLGGYAEASMVVWNVETGEAVNTIKDGGDPVMVIRWVTDPKRNTAPHSRMRQSFNSLLVGYSGGFVKEWSIDTSSNNMPMVLKWSQKVHRTQVTDLCSDNEIVLSYSTLDGAYLLLSSRGHCVPLVSYGVRVGILDTVSKKAVIGVDDGSVNIFSYSNYISGLSGPALIASFKPHISGITGMFLQLREDESWGRLICSGADGSIAFADYTKNKSGKWLKRIGAQSVVSMSNGGAIILTCAIGEGDISAIDPIELLPLPKQPDLGIKRSVTTLQWIEVTQKLFVGSEDGMLTVFDGTFDVDSNPSFHQIEERTLSPFFARNIGVGEPPGNLAVVNLQKGVLWHDGAFLVVDTKSVDLTYPIQPLPSMFPIRSSIISFTGSDSFNYTVILQLRDGTIMQYVGNSVNKTSLFVRILAGSLLSDVLQLESTGLTLYPSNYVLDILPSASGVPKLSMIFAEGIALKQIMFNASTTGEVERYVFAEKDMSSSGGNRDYEDSQLVVSICPVRQGELGFVIIRNSSEVDIVRNDGEYFYRISNGGDVLCYDIIGRKRRTRSFPVDAAILNNSISFAPAASPVACAADFCAAARYIAIGYRDGLVQLFDTTQRIIFARFAVHHKMIFGLWAFPSVVLSSSEDGHCRAERILPRVMYPERDSRVNSANTSSMLSH